MAQKHTDKIAAKAAAIKVLVDKYSYNFLPLAAPEGWLFLKREGYYEFVTEKLAPTRIAAANLDIEYQHAIDLMDALRKRKVWDLADIATDSDVLAFKDDLRSEHNFDIAYSSHSVIVNHFQANFQPDSPLIEKVLRFFSLIFGISSEEQEKQTFLIECLARIAFASKPLRYVFCLFGDGAGMIQLMDFICDAFGTYCESRTAAALTRIQYSNPHVQLRMKGARMLACEVQSTDGSIPITTLKQFIGGRLHTSDLFQKRTSIEQNFTVLAILKNFDRLKSRDSEFWAHALPIQLGESRRLNQKAYFERSTEIEDLYQELNCQEGFDALFCILSKKYQEIRNTKLQIPKPVRRTQMDLCQIIPHLGDFWEECTSADITYTRRARDMHACYLLWCAENPLHVRLSLGEFNRQSENLGYVRKSKNSCVYLSGRRPSPSYDPELRSRITDTEKARRGHAKKSRNK